MRTVWTIPVTAALHPARDTAVLHPLLRVKLLQRLHRVRNYHRHRQQGGVMHLVFNVPDCCVHCVRLETGFYSIFVVYFLDK